MNSTATAVTGVDFVTIPTQDYEKAKQFYGGVLGLEFGKPWGSMPAGEYETGTVTLAIMQTDAFGIDFTPVNVPLALHVDDVHAARKELEGHGVEFLADTMDSGVCHMAHFKDPDGNVLTFHNRYAPKGATPAGSSTDD